MDVKPSVCRMVMVGVDPTHNNGSDLAPAVIVRVWNDAMVNVKVFNDSPECQWKTSVHLFANEEEARAHGILNACFWPPRV